MFARPYRPATSCQDAPPREEIEVRPEAATAAHWWRDQLINNESLLNAPHLTDEQLDLFETSLARLVTQGLDPGEKSPAARILLQSISKPEGVLYNAARTAGISGSNIMFPMRTTMLVEEGRVRLKRFDSEYSDLPLF